MALSAKRPSRGDDVRKRILHEITETTEKKKRLNAEIEETLYRKIKMRAVEEGRSISDITRDLWSEYLSK
ncbi:plasmid partition protein ParG [uncultured Tateyamaria sp.]|uniref:plasmid partition protein ParG n=1 Tax=uncultured Tateyamaria sp. TaxID=455651 RepID=UPI00261AD96A|nr:plasmid partition protein ParG [uncultured Tateyamaria sp.]